MGSIYTCEMFLAISAFLIVPAPSQTIKHSSQKAEASEIQKDTYGDQLGALQFSMPCSDAAPPQVERGLALLHHMTYEGARAAFTAATRTDPDFAMGYWGQAMTYIYPLWSDFPNNEDFEMGQVLVGEAKARGQADREQLRHAKLYLSQNRVPP